MPPRARRRASERDGMQAGFDLMSGYKVSETRAGNLRTGRSARGRRSFLSPSAASPSLARGFSLLEVIVALSVLTICVSTLMHIFSGSVAATRTSNGYYGALEVAESRLAAAAAERNPVGLDSGESEAGYRWRTTVREYQPDNDNPLFVQDVFVDTERRFVPYHYHVEVEWGEPRGYHLELSTVRIGLKE